MIVCVTGDSVTLTESEDFGSFKLSVGDSSLDLAGLEQRFAPYGAVVGPATAWVDQAAVRRMAGPLAGPRWLEDFDAMIEKARPHGWIDEGSRIRAHIEWPDGTT